MELGVVRFSNLGIRLTKGRQAMDGKVIPFDPTHSAQSVQFVSRLFTGK